MLKNTNAAFKHIEWPVKNIQAFSTTIHHPSLQNDFPIYRGFNLGNHVGDSIIKVNANRSTLKNHFPAKTQLQWIEQVHGNQVVLIDKHESLLVGDALVTREKNIALAIMTADCLPILLSTKDGHVIAAIHGGWKPLVKGIIANTIKKMNVKPNELYAWLGPCIGNKKFEVGQDVYNVFKNINIAYESAFKSTLLQNVKPKYLADLHLIARIQLNALGVNKIYALPECTYSLKDTYYSYRRENVTGRMATIICSI